MTPDRPAEGDAGPAEVLRELIEAAHEDLGPLLQRASRAVNAAVAQRLAAEGHEAVRVAHAAVFMNLDPGGTRMVTLARRAGVSRQAIGQLVHDLQAAGYVAVEPDPQDGRATRVVLTPLGVAFCLRAAHVVREVEQQWQDLLGLDDLAALRRSLRALADAGTDDGTGDGEDPGGAPAAS